MLAALAAQASQQARAMGLVPGMMPAMMPGMPGMTLNSMVGVGRTGVDLRAGVLRELGIAPSDWTRLPGKLRDQVLQAAREGEPEAYRGLIKNYFQAIAKQGAKIAEWSDEEK